MSTALTTLYCITRLQVLNIRCLGDAQRLMVVDDNLSAK
jgi:hypothetical protein